MAKRGRPPKKRIEDKIVDALGAAKNLAKPAPVQDVVTTVITTQDVVLPSISEDVQDDYDFSRTNLHQLLVKGNKVLEGAIELAMESDQPRAFEVVGNLLKTLIEGQRELQTLQKDVRIIQKSSILDEREEEKPSEDKGIIMQATSLEMLDFIKHKREQEKLKGNPNSTQEDTDD